MTLRAYITIILYAAATLGRAQNLVYNGDFEIYSQCPTATSSQSSMQILYATGWAQAALSPDYFNACAGNANPVGTPWNGHGYQKDYANGYGYAGEYLLDAIDTNNSDREYIKTKLLDTLHASHKYVASMYVVKANFNYSIATAGMLFSSNSYSLPWPQGYIPANPQVLNSTLLSDTLNWILVQDTFIATGNELHLTIGNFNANANSDSVKAPGGFGTWWFYDAAYYFIDGVSVYDVTSGACNSYWDAGTDKYIFAGDSIRLGAIDTDGSTYLWQNSLGGNTFLSSNTDARPWASPTVTTTYFVIKNCGAGNIFMDTVTVNVQYAAGVAELNTIKILNVYQGTAGIMVEYSISSNATLEITGMDGRLLGKYTLSAAEHTAQIRNDNLENGVYLYRVITGGSQHKTGKIVMLK